MKINSSLPSVQNQCQWQRDIDLGPHLLHENRTSQSLLDLRILGLGLALLLLPRLYSFGRQEQRLIMEVVMDNIKLSTV
jgi:hypothetical protein